MSKLNILAVAALLLVSCSKNTEEPTIKTFSPKLTGIMGQLTDVNAPSTKAGVIEDNPNYATQGEQFYWVNGDEAKVLFFPDGDLNSTPIEVTYTAVVPAGTKPGSCDFTTAGTVPAGTYTVYALYPAAGWSKDANGYKATSTTDIIQADATSEHLGRDMFMKAKAINVTINEGGSPINLSFKHLSSLVRFRVRNTLAPQVLQYVGFKLVDMFGSGTVYFPTQAYLAAGIDDNSLTPVESSRKTGRSVDIQQSFIQKGIYKEFTAFLPLLPTGAPTNSVYKLSLNSTITDENGANALNPDFGTGMGLSFQTDIPFLANGFEAGKSYYFNLTMN